MLFGGAARCEQVVGFSGIGGQVVELEPAEICDGIEWIDLGWPANSALLLGFHTLLKRCGLHDFETP